MATFAIATSRTWTDKASQERRERTDWHNIVCWNRTAEIANQYLHKGSYVFVEGELQTRTYEREGQKHYRTEVNVRELVMLDRTGNQNEGASYGGGQSQYDRPARSGGGSNSYNQGNQGYGRQQQPQQQYGSDRYEGSTDADTDLDSGTDEDLPF